MIAIVAADREWGIGRGGRLPWRLPGDLAYFKERTMGGAVVMGRRTFESLAAGLGGHPSPLPGRTNIVLTRDADYGAEGITVVHSAEELLDVARGLCEKVFVCGGADIYRLLMPHTESCLVTRLDFSSGADTFFPLDDEGEDSFIGGGRRFVLASESAPVTEKDILSGRKVTYRFCEYRAAPR